MNIYDDKSVKFKMRSHGKILYRDLLKGMLSMTMLIDFANGLFSSLHIGEIFRVLLLGICGVYILRLRYGKKEKRVLML